METLKKKPTLIGVTTLIVGLGLGAGIGVWSAHKSQASGSSAESRHFSPPLVQPSSSASDEKPDAFREFDQLHQEIDRAIRRSTQELELDATMRHFRPQIGYSSSFDLRDRGDHFEIRAYLPDVNTSDVKVELDDANVLHLSATQHQQEVKSEKESEARVIEMGRYEEVITLPEPVRREALKVDRRENEIIVTIPKAKAKQT